MAKKPDTAEQLAKAAEARARREALQSAAFGAEPEKPATVPAEPTPPPAPTAAPKAPVEPVDGDDDKAALVEAGEDDDAPARPQRPRATKPKPKAAQQASRVDTVAVTYHGPAIVRQQLKLLSAEKDRKMGDLIAEALNLLFRKYDKAAIAPREK